MTDSAPSSPKRPPFVLIIRDGWGRNPNDAHDPFNAIKLADTPVGDRLLADYPSTLIKTSGLDVGLPDGTMGNSEVGHQNIGAGRVVDQESVRITKACRSGELGENEALTNAIRGATDAGKSVHLMGICSDAGVHGLIEHLEAIVRLCKDMSAPTVFVHLFTDGRDTGPFTGKGYIEQVESMLAEIGVGKIASVIGRYWAMDRDNRWERVARAYACMIGRDTEKWDVAHASTAGEAIQRHYDHPASDNMRGDEFCQPTMIGETGEALCGSRITGSDCAIFYNYRGDRPREICSAFLLPEFFGADEVKPSPDSGERGFDRGDKLDLRFVLMTAYSERLAQLAPVAFPKPPKMKNILGSFLASRGLTQFRCAETEKYPHVTFFFNDYRDEPFECEHRANPQSPRVSTYDQAPEMAAADVERCIIDRLDADDCEDVIVVNFANPDMVGHTGSLEAVIKACETVDACVGRIVDKTLARGGSLIVTADHGNAEQMFDPATNAPHTAHTTYDVPLILVADAHKNATLREGGRLADIVPTMLEVMGVAKAPEMTGESLIA